MAVYAIGDPHLSKVNPKPMDIFGPAWRGHPERFFTNWRRTVSSADTVLIPGDISWAMRLEEALPDLQDIDALPGQKVLIQGNHDYWWSAIGKVRQLPLQTMRFIQNDYIRLGDTFICGTRGWLCPGSGAWDEDPVQSEKLYKREVVRLGLSLESARRAGATHIIVMLHYPPVADHGQATEFMQLLLGEPAVRQVLYGHLHGLAPGAAFEGQHGGKLFRLVACDYIDFTPELVQP